MAVPHQKFREVVFQILYSIEMGIAENEQIIPLLMKELSLSKKTVREAHAKAQKVLEHIEEIDQKIQDSSKSYELERIHLVERNALRLGIFEMLHDPDIPPKVAIAESLRLSKKFGTPEAASFVNAIMDHIYKSHETV